MKRKLEKMKIGILTYHRVYNYGAVLQAYCTQQILNTMGFENEIIDFYIPRQKDYTNLYPIKNGFKRFAKTLMLVPFHKKRVRRKQKFDEFVDGMKLSANGFIEEEALSMTNMEYDCFFIGSDQIWNVKKKAEYSDAYMLNFADNEKLKVSYATSIGIATIEDLLPKREYLSRFNAISCREIGGSKVLTELMQKNIQTVLDPTLLVKREIIDEITVKMDEEPYLLYYSLDGFDKRENNIEILKLFSEKYNLKVKFVTPEWPYHLFGEEIIDAGPKEFLSLIKNASLVCTNSFHGTALSIKLQTPFYVLEEREQNDERKRSILKQLELENRIVSSLSEAKKITNYQMEFENVDAELAVLITQSMEYLERSLEGK